LLAATAPQPHTTLDPVVKRPSDAPLCPHCGSILIFVQILRPQSRRPP
jgi:hypothetical protein